MDIINKRRSVRKFSDVEVTNQEIELLLRAGFQAPTARNQKSIGFIVVDDRNILDELTSVAPGCKVLANANKAIIVLELPSPETPHMRHQDLAAATENILLEATSLNIGSCWLGIAPHIDRVSKANAILNVSADMNVFSIIALGHLLDENDLYFKDKFDKERVYYNKVR